MRWLVQGGKSVISSPMSPHPLESGQTALDRSTPTISHRAPEAGHA